MIIVWARDAVFRHLFSQSFKLPADFLYDTNNHLLDTRLNRPTDPNIKKSDSKNNTLLIRQVHNLIAYKPPTISIINAIDVINVKRIIRVLRQSALCGESYDDHSSYYEAVVGLLQIMVHNHNIALSRVRRE